MQYASLAQGGERVNASDSIKGSNLDRACRVTHLPGGLVASKVTGEGLLSPRTGDWVADRGESGHRLVKTRVLEERNEGTMTSHAAGTNHTT